MHKRTSIFIVITILILLASMLPMTGAVQAQGLLNQTFDWMTKNLSVGYPDGWTARVLGEFSQDVLGLAADPASLNAVGTGGDSPASPMVLVVLTNEPETLFGPRVVGTTVQETAANWAATSVGTSATFNNSTVVGLEAVRVHGIAERDLVAVMANVAQMADGDWLFVFAAVPLQLEDRFIPIYDAIVSSLNFGMVESLITLTETATWEPAALTMPHPAAWSIEAYEDNLILAQQRIDFTRIQFGTVMPPEGPLFIVSTHPGAGANSDALRAVALDTLNRYQGVVPAAMETLVLAGYNAVRVTGSSDTLGTTYMITAVQVGDQIVVIEGRVAQTQQIGFPDFYDAVLNGVTLAGQGGGMAVQVVEVLTP